jgi:hypothetical protein
MIAIALYGNEWLSGADASAHTALDSTNSTFQFVRRFSVHLPGTHLTGAERVGTADALFEWLRKAGTDQLGLVVRASSKKDPDPIPPAIAAAFSNGGQWALVGVGRQNSTWTDQWEVADRDAPDRRIWDVDLLGKRVAEPMDIRSFGVGDSLARLKTALERTHEFAKSNDLAPWTDWFGAPCKQPRLPIRVTAFTRILRPRAGCQSSAANSSQQRSGVGCSEEWVRGTTSAFMAAPTVTI